ncbi:MAG: prepilin-type N-terminal cleavage/methylation domain-containing protein [Candidatus Omnitrophica bacterium]|nr:prepilin-type N-terminal cleavage/methylation domain-containing protein [Candidatus Omnitrophota bacterium]
MNSPRRKSAGFTLIELLIVFVIIGVLAGLAVPQYQKIVERAKVQGVIACMGALKTGAMAYYTEKGATNGFAGITVAYLDTFGLDAAHKYGGWTCSVDGDTDETECVITMTSGADTIVLTLVGATGVATWSGTSPYKPN